MPGTGISNQSAEGIQVPVTTGEFATQEPSTVPERVMSDIRPPESSITAPATTAPIEDAAKAEAFSAIDQAAAAGASEPPANSGLDYREENAGVPVEINTGVREAVAGSLGGNHQGLEAQIGGSVEESAPKDPVPAEIPTPPEQIESAPAPVIAPEPAGEPVPPAPVAPVVESQRPAAAPEPAIPEQQPVQPGALQTASAESTQQIVNPRELKPDEAPEISELTTQEDFKQFVDGFLDRKPELEVKSVAGVGVDRDSFQKATTLVQVQKEILFLREIGRSDAQLASIIKSYIEAEAITGEVK